MQSVQRGGHIVINAPLNQVSLVVEFTSEIFCPDGELTMEVGFSIGGGRPPIMTQMKSQEIHPRLVVDQ